MSRYFITAAAGALALGFAGVASAQEATTFDFEYDPEQGAAFEDFNAGVDEWGLYERWDADRDDALTREEFHRGLFGTYDVDRDEVLSEEEIGRMREEQLFADETVKAGGAATETQD